jgi:hypothetical protein
MFNEIYIGFFFSFELMKQIFGCFGSGFSFVELKKKKSFAL